MDDSKSQQIKQEHDLALNESMDTTNVSNNTKVELNKKRVIKDAALRDEIKIEIKEEPEDSSEEAAILPRDDYLKHCCTIMEDCKSQQIKLDVDLGSNKLMNTAKVNDDIKMKIEKEGVIKETVLCDEIKIEIKEEPDDSSSEASTSPRNDCCKLEVPLQNLTLPVNRQLHNEIDTNQKLYIGEKCNKVLDPNSEIVKVYSVTKIYSCTMCNKTLADASSLRRHEKTHLGSKRFSCDECSKTFSQSSHLRRHENSHVGLKPYSCNECSKTFSRSSDLNRHKDSHLGLKLFSCDECSKTFTQSSSLKQHRNTHLGLKPFCCSICNKSFSRPGSLRYHQKTHLGSRA